MKRLGLAVLVAACGGGGTHATTRAPASTTCVPAGFAAEVVRVDGARVTVCDEGSCAALDASSGTWEVPTDAEIEQTRALDVIGSAGFSQTDSTIEVCDDDACTTFRVGDAHVRDAAYDHAQDLLVVVTEDTDGSHLHLRTGSIVSTGALDAPNALTLAILGDHVLAGPWLFDARTLEGTTVGGGEPWSQVGGWAQVDGALWAFGDGAATVVLQHLARGVVATVDVWPTAGAMIGPERLGTDLVVARDGEIVVISAAGEIRGRFTAPVCKP